MYARADGGADIACVCAELALKPLDAFWRYFGYCSAPSRVNSSDGNYLSVDLCFKKNRSAIRGLYSQGYSARSGNVPVSACDTVSQIIPLTSVFLVNGMDNIGMYLWQRHYSLRIKSDCIGKYFKIFQNCFVIVTATEGQVQ
jgi:hypothetical protein